MIKRTHALILAGVLAFSTTPTPAFAEGEPNATINAAVQAAYPGGPTQADIEALNKLQDEAIKAVENYERAQAKLDEVEAKVESAGVRLSEIEDALPAQQERTAAAIRSQYKMQVNQLSVLEALFSAQSFDEFLSIERAYLAIRDYNLEQTDALAKLQREYDSVTFELNKERNEAQKDRDAAEKAQQDAQDAVNAARQKAQEKAEAAKAAYEQAEADRKAAEDAARAAAEAAAAAAANSPAPTAAPTASGIIDNRPASAIDPYVPAGTGTGEFQYVLASMYGTDDGLMYSHTATGEIVTPTSMGVAMRTMPLGTIIEITYNGRTCTAVVNDRGPYVGNRQIDLQPAVAWYLGFDGVGTVGYRIVS